MKARIYVMTAVGTMLLALIAYAAAKQTKETTMAKETAVAKETTTAKETEAKQTVVFENEMAMVSYAIGTQVGQSFKAQDIEINLDTFVQGLQDVLADRQLALKPAELQQVMMDFQKQMMAKHEKLRERQGEKNLAESKFFLEQNKSKPGVIVLPSGLQYKVIKEGTGRTPTATDKVKTHYRGTLISGEEFDSSYKRGRPAEFAVKGVIAGWTEALQLMKEGAKWQLFIPADLAYGKQGRPSIPPNAALIFEIELLEIVTPQKK